MTAITFTLWSPCYSCWLGFTPESGHVAVSTRMGSVQVPDQNARKLYRSLREAGWLTTAEIEEMERAFAEEMVASEAAAEAEYAAQVAAAEAEYSAQMTDQEASWN